MERKIQRLEEELAQKDKKVKELQKSENSLSRQEAPQYLSTDVSKSQTVIPKKQDGYMDETESEGEDFGCDSVKVSSKPSRLHFDESIQMNKQASLTPVHQATKSFDQNDKKLIIKIDTANENGMKCMVSQDSDSNKNPGSEKNSV